MTEFTETLGTDGVNPLHPEQTALGASVSQEAKFRTGLVSLAGRLHRIVGRRDRLPALQPDRPVHQHLLLPSLSRSRLSARATIILGCW